MVCLLKLFKVVIFGKGINRTHMLVRLLTMLANIRTVFLTIVKFDTEEKAHAQNLRRKKQQFIVMQIPLQIFGIMHLVLI